MLMGRGFTLPQSTIEICGFPGLKIETRGTQHQARMGNPTLRSGTGDKTRVFSRMGSRPNQIFQSYRAAAPASATAWSCSPEPPLTPMAPTTLPSILSGIPPAKIMILPSFEAWIPKN